EFVHYGEFKQVEEIEHDIDNPNENQKASTMLSAIRKLEEVYEVLNYLTKPIRFESVLLKNKNGRYETAKGDKEFTSGSKIEFFDEEWNEWVVSRVEYKNEDYYIFSYPRINMDGLKVR